MSKYLCFDVPFVVDVFGLDHHIACVISGISMIFKQGRQIQYIKKLIQHKICNKSHILASNVFTITLSEISYSENAE